MTRQFPPRIEAQRAGVQARQSFAGSAAGLSRNAGPVHKADRSVVRVPTSTTLSRETFWIEDHFSVTSGSLGPFTLTYVPRDNSEDIKVNGVGALRVTEWTRSGATLSVAAGVFLGIGVDTWDLTVQYEVASAAPTVATPPSPSLVGVYGGGPISLPSAPTATNIAILAACGNTTSVSGAFATWTQIRHTGTGFSQGVDLWVGTGVGTGTSITSSGGGFTVVAVYDGASAVAIRNLTSTFYPNPTSGLSTVASGAATAVVGDIAFGATFLTGGSSNFYPSGTYTASGFSLEATDKKTTTTQGTVVVAGVANATSISSSFGVGADVTGWGEAITASFSWTPA